MGHLSVTCEQGAQKRVSLCVHVERGGVALCESTTLLRTAAIERDTVVLEANDDCVLVGEFRDQTRSTTLCVFRLSLKEAPLGERWQSGDWTFVLALEVEGGGTELPLPVTVCALDFGTRADVTTAAPIDLDSELEDLFSRRVLDVQVLEFLNLPRPEKSAARKAERLVLLTHGPGVPAFLSLEKTQTDVKFDIPWDATFVVDASDLRLRVSVFEDRNASKATHGLDLNLRDVVFYPSAPSSYSTWYRLQNWGLKDAVAKDAGWVRIALQINMETDQTSGMLCRYGTPVSSLPFRVNVGDVILVNNHSMTGFLISAATHSEWDHVALVACTETGDVLFFEATKEGAYAYPFDDRVRAILATGAVFGVRRLQRVDRSKKFFQQMAAFVSAHHGKPYEEKLLTLVKSNFKANASEDLSSLFCSELVAAGLKQVGVIAPTFFASNFSPKDFALDDVSFLMGGARLERMRMYKNLLRANSSWSSGGTNSSASVSSSQKTVSDSGNSTHSSWQAFSPVTKRKSGGAMRSSSGRGKLYLSGDTSPTDAEEPAPSRVLVDWTQLDFKSVVGGIAAPPPAGMPLRSCMWRGKTFEDAFSARDGVDWLVDRHPLSRVGAVLLFQKMQKQNLIEPVKAHRQFRDKDAFFVLKKASVQSKLRLSALSVASDARARKEVLPQPPPFSADALLAASNVHSIPAGANRGRRRSSVPELVMSAPLPTLGELEAMGATPKIAVCYVNNNNQNNNNDNNSSSNVACGASACTEAPRKQSNSKLLEANNLGGSSGTIRLRRSNSLPDVTFDGNSVRNRSGSRGSLKGSSGDDQYHVLPHDGVRGPITVLMDFGASPLSSPPLSSPPNETSTNSAPARSPSPFLRASVKQGEQSPKTNVRIANARTSAPLRSSMEHQPPQVAASTEPTTVASAAKDVQRPPLPKALTRISEASAQVRALGVARKSISEIAESSDEEEEQDEKDL